MHGRGRTALAQQVHGPVMLGAEQRGGMHVTCLKSSTVSVSPMESMRKPRPYVNRSLLNQSSADGRPMPTAAPKHTWEDMQHILHQST